MPFLGAIPPQMRSIARETVADWPGDQLYVACCGNLTLERSVYGLGRKVHSEDVSVYSTALGRWLTGQDPGIQLAEESRDELEWIAGSFGSPIDTVATVMLGTGLFPAVGRDGAYFKRTVRGYREQWPQLHAATVAKLDEVAKHVRVDSYDCVDCRDWLATIPADAPLCSFPPFYSSGYEALYEPLERHLTWDNPTYQPLSQDDIARLLHTMTGRPYWLIGTNLDLADLAGFKRGVVQPTSRSAPVHIYASRGPTRIAMPRQKIEPVKVARLGPGEEIGRTLTIAPLEQAQFNALRAQYMNPKIAPSLVPRGYAVLAGGRIVGAFAFGRSEYFPDAAYLLSDFPVAPTDYPRLSKLVLLAATSAEAQLVMQRSLNRRLVAVSTTVFTSRPVSMKYRGLFNLVKRSPSTDPEWEWTLTYQAPLGGHTLKQAAARWRQKWAQRQQVAA